MIITLTYRTCINPRFCVSLRSAAAVLSVMWRQAARYLQQSCIIAPCITVRLQQGYSNTKIHCKIFPPSQNYPECNINSSILLYCTNVVLYCRFLQYCAAKSTAISNSVQLCSIRSIIKIRKYIGWILILINYFKDFKCAEKMCGRCVQTCCSGYDCSLMYSHCFQC